MNGKMIENFLNNLTKFRLILTHDTCINQIYLQYKTIKLRKIIHPMFNKINY